MLHELASSKNTFPYLGTFVGYDSEPFGHD
jgi:hypothetical protein